MSTKRIGIRFLEFTYETSLTYEKLLVPTIKYVAAASIFTGGIAVSVKFNAYLLPRMMQSLINGRFEDPKNVYPRVPETEEDRKVAERVAMADQYLSILGKVMVVYLGIIATVVAIRCVSSCLLGKKITWENWKR